MSTALLGSCLFSSRIGSPRPPRVQAWKCAAIGPDEQVFQSSGDSFSRRAALFSSLSLISSANLAFPGEGLAINRGLLAGRIPGLSDPDESGSSHLFSLKIVKPIQFLDFAL